MGLKLKPIKKRFGAYASGVDLADELSLETVGQIEAAMDRFSVLVWSDCRLTDDEQLTLARYFGEVEVSLLSVVRGKGGPKDKSLVPISNVDDGGEMLKRDGRRLGSQVANQLWHSDSSFMQSVAKYSLLSAREVPKSGGDTEFADLRAAYDDLPRTLKVLTEGRIAEHHALHSRVQLGLKYTDEEMAASKPAYWPLIREHPTSKRNIIFSPIHIKSIEGMSDPEARMLVNELIEHATQEKFCIRHKWSQNDLVMWDNRSTLHRGRRYDLSKKRILRRITTMENNIQQL
tara:strand:+ start:261 stop:1127 length:867 start_codon:yes stop_codon:yes gene_type:complete